MWKTTAPLVVGLAMIAASACGDETGGEGGAGGGGTSTSSSSSGSGGSSSGSGGSSSGSGGSSSGSGGSSSGSGGSSGAHAAECAAMCDKTEQLGCNPEPSCAQNCEQAAALAEIAGCQTELSALFACVDQVTDCNAVCDAEDQALSQCVEAFCTANPDQCP